MKNTTKKKLAGVAILFLVSAMSFVPLNGVTLLKASAANQTQGFNVINAVWGTQASPISAAPGDRADSLTLTLQYILSATAESIQGYLQLPSGFSLYNGSSVAYAATTGVYPTGSTVTLSFLVQLSPALALGSYVMPLDLSWTAAGYGYLLNDTVPVTVQVEGRPQLYFSYDSASSPLIAGQVNQVPFIISNNGSGTASSIFVSATSQAGGVLNTIPEIQSLGSGSASTGMLQVFVPVSAAGSVIAISLSASYKDPYGNSESATQVISTYVSPQSQPKLEVSTDIVTLSPGQVNTIPVNITNTGSLTLSQISTLLVVQPSSATILGTFPYIKTLNAGSSLGENLSIYVPSTLANSALSITLTSSFVEPSGSTGSASQTLGFYTSSYTAPAYNTTLSLIPLNTNVTTGQESKVSFKLQNIGSSSVFTPTVSMSVSSPLVTVANSTFGYNQAIAPKSSVIFEAILTSSPSSTLGTYSGSVSVIYQDQQGTQHTQSFTVGFVLSGTIKLAAESETVAQSQRTLAVSGTLLNEGTASAYYASVVGCVVQRNSTGLATSFPGSRANFTSGSTFTSTGTTTSFTRSFPGPGVGPGFGGFGGGGGASGIGGTLTSCPRAATSTYVGEIDPNSPVAFTATAAYTPSNSSSLAVLVLVVTFLNTYGANASQPIDKVITLTASSAQTSVQSPTATTTASHLYVKIAFYGVVVAVVAAAIAGGGFIRKSRRIQSSNDEGKVV